MEDWLASSSDYLTQAPLSGNALANLSDYPLQEPESEVMSVRSSELLYHLE